MPAGRKISDRNHIMKKCILLFLVLSSILVMMNGLSAGDSVSELSASSKELIYDSCFEVVILKPVNDSLTYEKSLPWDLVPFHIRNDKYFSIGTAFAISSKELVTAYHVLDLDRSSLIYKNFYIRDKNQNVYEVDDILMMDNDRDFVKFTVKGKTFDKWLPIAEKYEINSMVFTVGNAYGEGIIIRKGDLVGTIPEDENGKWEYLRSSSDVNSGNSGGPLLNTQTQVVGVVVSRQDNISYSLPMKEVLSGNPAKGRLHKKTFYGFSLIQGKQESVMYDYETVLPKKYGIVNKELFAHGNNFYVKTMDKLFSDMKGDMFPSGDNSLELLFYGTNYSFPQLIFKDKNSQKWYATNFNTETYPVEKDGKIIVAKVTDDMFLMDLRKPENVSLKDLYASPKLMMDTLLKGINIPRKIGDKETRILSLGNPYMTTSYKDKYGRKWEINAFLIEYMDELFITFSLPTPKGEIVLFKNTASANIDVWLYDMKKMTELMYVPYYGKVAEWNEFLRFTDILPDKVNTIKVKAEKGKTLSVSTQKFIVDVPSDVIPISDDTEVTINFDFYPDKGRIVWDVRRILVSEYNKDNYFSLYRHVKPDAKLPEVCIKGWNDILDKKHPYNVTSFVEDGRTNIATVIETKNKPAAKPDGSSMVYTLYLGYEGSVDGEKMKTLISSLSNRIQIRD
jgi:serine protease Do